MSSSGTIVIKIEIQIPAGGAAPTVLVAGPQRADSDKVDPEKSTLRCPNAGSTIPFRSGPGTICGWAKFGDSVPDEAYALVLSPTEAGNLGAEDPPPLGSGSNGRIAATGVKDASDMTKFLWNTNEIPGAQVGQNAFVIWTRRGTCAWDHESHVFTAFEGTSNPCGLMAGSGSGCFTFTSEPATAAARPKAGIFPAVWLVAGGGFAAPALAMFNALLALRQVPGTGRLIWDNAGDGKQAPHAQLKLCPTDGWVLALRFAGAEVSYTVPFQGDPFGPIEFAERHGTVAGVGPMALPRIVVSPV